MKQQFPVVPWATGATMYEVNIRQFTPEGTFKAFAKHLPRLRDMGVRILWFMPITPISKMEDGFVITAVNGKEVKNLDELKEALAGIRSGNIRIDGFYPGFEGRYTYPLRIEE